MSAAKSVVYRINKKNGHDMTNIWAFSQVLQNNKKIIIIKIFSLSVENILSTLTAGEMQQDML